MLKSTTLGCYFLKITEKNERAHTRPTSMKRFTNLLHYFFVYAYRSLVFAWVEKTNHEEKKILGMQVQFFLFSACFAFFTQTLTILADIRKVRPYVRIGAKMHLVSFHVSHEFK